MMEDYGASRAPFLNLLKHWWRTTLHWQYKDPVIQQWQHDLIDRRKRLQFSDQLFALASLWWVSLHRKDALSWLSLAFRLITVNSCFITCSDVVNIIRPILLEFFQRLLSPFNTGPLLRCQVEIPIEHRPLWCLNDHARPFSHDLFPIDAKGCGGLSSPGRAVVAGPVHCCNLT